ncbi:unnamed protein product, partial [Staurois parvus]
MYVHKHTRTHTCTCTQTHVHTCRHMYRHTCTHTHTHTKPYKKLQYFVTFTHRAGYCTLGGGREHSTHSFLCSHFAQLLSSLTAPSASDRSGRVPSLLSKMALGTHLPPPSFPLANVIRRVEISRPTVKYS